MVKSSLILNPTNIYLGPRTSASSAFISSNGITHVLSIGSTPIANNIPGVTYSRLSLSDDPSSSIDQVSDMADVFIGAAKPGKILIHCSAAVSRSPTIVAAYLMKKCNMSLKDALGLIIRTRPAVCPNPGFLKQLKDMEISLRGISSLNVDSLPPRKDQRLALFAAS